MTMVYDKGDDRTPVIVHNPYREELMNVEPFFCLLEEYADRFGYRLTDSAIKYMALANGPEWFDNDERQNIVMFLYRLRDMLDETNECRIKNVKKGGAK